MIPQTDAVAGKIEGCKRIQEAGSQTAQAAVAQRGFRLHLFDVRKILACGIQRIAHLVIKAQVDQVIGKQLSDQELRADIVELPALHRANLPGALFVHQLLKSKIKLAVGASMQGFSCQSGERVSHSHKRTLLFLFLHLHYTTNILQYLARNDQIMI